MREVKSFPINRYFQQGEENAFIENDVLPIEQALQIRLYHHGEKKFKDFTITMRTPHADKELAVGFLLSENLIQKSSDIEQCIQADENLIHIKLNDGIDTDQILGHKRNFVISSSCGICGDMSIDHPKNESFPAVVNATRSLHKVSLHKAAIFNLVDQSFEKQNLFKTTGGLHSSTLFNAEGEVICIREDVGRHNALDKVNGYAVINNLLPLSSHLLLLSGRVSYELIQKAAMSGIRVICALGAPSSLAVETATRLDITLIAFMTAQKFNVYHQSTWVSIL